MITYYITPVRARERHRRVEFKSGAETVKFDYTSWAEDNGTVTSVTWTVKSGQASISSESLSSNVASALITLSESGRSLIKLTVTDGTHTDIQWLEIMAKDLDIVVSTDYNLVSI